MPTQTRSQTISQLKASLEDKDAEIQKLKDMLFFKTANGREMEAFQDLVNWLAHNHIELEKLIRDNFNQLPGFDGEDYTDIPSIKPYLMDAIDKEIITDYRVYDDEFSFRKNKTSQGDMATKSEYRYLIRWIDKNLYNLLKINRETGTVNCRIISPIMGGSTSSYGDIVDRIGFWLKYKIKTGKMSAFRYDYNIIGEI